MLRCADFPREKNLLFAIVSIDLTFLNIKILFNLPSYFLMNFTIRVDGLIVSNTTISREGLKSEHAKETGGLSGKPLR